MINFCANVHFNRAKIHDDIIGDHPDLAYQNIDNTLDRIKTLETRPEDVDVFVEMSHTGKTLKTYIKDPHNELSVTVERPGGIPYFHNKSFIARYVKGVEDSIKKIDESSKILNKISDKISKSGNLFLLIPDKLTRIERTSTRYSVIKEDCPSKEKSDILPTLINSDFKRVVLKKWNKPSSIKQINRLIDYAQKATENLPDGSELVLSVNKNFNIIYKNDDKFGDYKPVIFSMNTEKLFNANMDDIEDCLNKSFSNISYLDKTNKITNMSEEDKKLAEVFIKYPDSTFKKQLKVLDEINKLNKENNFFGVNISLRNKDKQIECEIVDNKDNKIKHKMGSYLSDFDDEDYTKEFINDLKAKINDCREFSDFVI